MHLEFDPEKFKDSWCELLDPDSNNESAPDEVLSSQQRELPKRTSRDSREPTQNNFDLSHGYFNIQKFVHSLISAYNILEISKYKN